jgi:hypothetical protein
LADRNTSPGAAFLVDDFITSITTQLDRVQDALRIKAVNRPLTYALRELHMELKVFVDLDNQGQVLLRAAGPNEAGASTLALDFTTITKPMIEENTVSLAATRSTPLDKLGLAPGEQMRLERMGVSNLAQLERLKGSTGVSTVARLADMPVDRVRRALQAGLPQLGGVGPGSRPPPAPQPPHPVMQPPHPVMQPPQPPSPPPRFTPPVKDGPRTFPPLPPRPLTPAPRAGVPLSPGVMPIGPRQLLQRRLEVAPDTPTLALAGSNLLHEDYPPEVRLNGEALEVQELDDDRLVVRLPENFAPGALEVRLGEQPAQVFALVHGPADEPEREAGIGDPWAPEGARR